MYEEGRESLRSLSGIKLIRKAQESTDALAARFRDILLELLAEENEWEVDADDPSEWLRLRAGIGAKTNSYGLPLSPISARFAEDARVLELHALVREGEGLLSNGLMYLYPSAHEVESEWNPDLVGDYRHMLPVYAVAVVQNALDES